MNTVDPRLLCSVHDVWHLIKNYEIGEKEQDKSDLPPPDKIVSGSRPRENSKLKLPENLK